MEKLAQLALNDEGFAFDPTSGDSYQVNHVGLFILNGLREGKEDPEVAQMLTEEYEVSQEDANRDMADFSGRLKTFGLV